MEYKVKNTDSFIILYCKKWVKYRTNFIKDLRKLVAHWTGMEVKYITKNEVADVLLQIVEKYNTIDKHFLRNFLTDMSPESCWKTGYETNDYPYKEKNSRLPSYNFTNALIYKCASILRNLKIYETSTDGKTEKVLVELDEFKEIQETMFEILGKNTK
jgi:hypothetical protein